MKLFYKWINNTEMCDGLSTNTKLMYDPRPLEKNIQSSGIYISNIQNVFAFISDNSVAIKACIVPDNVKIHEIKVKSINSVKYKTNILIFGPSHPINEDTVRYLHERGADIHINDEWLFRWACCNNKLDIIKYAVENGANIHARKEYGLRWACSNGYFEIAEYLINNGANCLVNNCMPIKLAYINKFTDISTYLINTIGNDSQFLTNKILNNFPKLEDFDISQDDMNELSWM